MLYDMLCAQVKALAEADGWYVPLMSNAAALLYEALPEVNWAGFYLMRGGALDYRRGEMERQNSLYRANVAAGSKPSALSLAGSLMSVAGSSMQMYAMGSGDRLTRSQAPKKTGGETGVGVSSRTAMGSRSTMTHLLY